MTAASIAATVVAQNAATADVVGTTYNVADGMNIPSLPRNHLIRITNTDDDTNLTVTFKAGQCPPAIAAGQGDLAVVVPFGTTRWVVLESGRFLQSDGSVNVASTVNTGKITVFDLPTPV